MEEKSEKYQVSSQTRMSTLSITKSQLETAFRTSRCKETSLDPDFRSEQNIDWVQCTPTFIVTKICCGGLIGVERFMMQDNISGRISNIRHFFNIIDGEVIDFTRNQMNCRETVRNVKILKIGEPIIAHNQNIEDYYSCLDLADLREKTDILFQRVKEKLALVLQEPLQAMGMSFDEYLVDHKLLLDDPNQ